MSLLQTITNLKHTLSDQRETLKQTFIEQRRAFIEQRQSLRADLEEIFIEQRESLKQTFMELCQSYRHNQTGTLKSKSRPAAPVSCGVLHAEGLSRGLDRHSPHIHHEAGAQL